MLAQPIHNKTTLRRGSAPSVQIIAPVRGVACESMNWTEFFRYDTETGNLIWLERPVSHFKSPSIQRGMNKRLAGTVAGNRIVTKRGRPHCIQLHVMGRQPVAHRIIWEMHHGPIPEGMLIDHINGNPWDNRLENLRLATHAQNAQNSSHGTDNKTGMKGVYWVKRLSRWKAQIGVNRKRIGLGTYAKVEDAHAAYCNAAAKYHGEFARTK